MFLSYTVGDVMLRIFLCFLFIIITFTSSHAKPTKKQVDLIKKANGQVERIYQSGKHKQALDLAQKVKTNAEQTLGKEHPETLNSVNNLAVLYQAQGRYALAEPLLKRALEARTRVLGKEHPSTLISVNNLGFLYQAQGRYDLAEPLYKQRSGGSRACSWQRAPEHAS